MLNIPSEITQLLKMDGVQKNLRIHFPNGELPDITNDHILADSLEFTESVCSAKTLQLGLAESSVLSFYCADLPNFRGATIEAYIDVENNGSYYPIPLGVFTVDECRRQKDLITRKVVAYSKAGVASLADTGDMIRGSVYGVSNFEHYRRICTVYSDLPYDSELKKWIKSMIDNSIDEDDQLISLTPIQLSDTPISRTQYYDALYIVDIGIREAVQYAFKDPRGKPTVTGISIWNDCHDLFAYRSSMSYDERRKAVFDLISNAGYTLQTLKSLGKLGASVTHARRKGSSTNSYVYFGENADIAEEGYIYPYVRGVHTTSTSYAGYTIITIPTKIDVIVKRRSNQAVLIPSTVIDLGSFDMYKVDTSAYTDVDKITISFPRKKVTSTEYKTVLPENFNLHDLTRSYAELDVSFGLFDRITGNLDFKEIGQGGQMSVDASHTSDVEYDEEQAIYTSVHAFYTAGSSSDEYVKEIDGVSDNNPYIINSNYLMNNGYLTEDQVQTFVDQIAQKLSTYKYVPCNITMVGAPQMEAGDILHITLKDGTEMDIPVLRRTLRGIQVLEDTIDIL